MSESGKWLKLKTTIHAPALEVYDSMTNAVALTDWFCNLSNATPQEGGGIYLWWTNQVYVSGTFITLKPGKKIDFTWHGNGEPGRTQVQIQIKDKTDHVVVHLLHSGMGKGKLWRPYRKHIKRLWKAGLDNLKSVLETGQDLRLCAELSEQGWEIPVIPATLDEISAHLEEIYSRVNQYLAATFTETDSDHSGWSIEYYTHAITYEQRLHTWIEELLSGQDPGLQDSVDLTIKARATAVSFPGSAELKKELKNNQSVTTAMIANIPGEIYHHKRKYWLLGLKLYMHGAALERKIKQISGSISSTTRTEVNEGDAL